MVRNGRIAIAGLAMALVHVSLGLGDETNRIERGTLTFEYGAIVFSSRASTNRFPLADKKKVLPLPGLSVVSFDERVLATREGETWGVSTVHLRTSGGDQFALDEHKPVNVLLETRLSIEGGKTNTVYVWRLREEQGASNQPPQDTRGP